MLIEGIKLARLLKRNDTYIWIAKFHVADDIFPEKGVDTHKWFDDWNTWEEFWRLMMLFIKFSYSKIKKKYVL